MRVVVVGSGIAGLVAALRASTRHEVVLVTKAGLVDSSTRYAQGGIAAALAPDDAPAAHIADTIAAGAGLCDPRAVEVLCTEGPDRVRDLIALGVAFDREVDGALARGHEAAHSRRRVLHAGGDATGLAIELALVDAVRRAPVEVREHTVLAELVLEGGAPRAAGVEVLDDDGRMQRIPADAVVLATGGAGRLYPHTTNPAVATGDGIAAAWRAGAQIVDAELVQFHPTALGVAGCSLISEAVRGEGAVLLDERGERFMRAVHPDAELAPRDVVARGIAAAMAAQGGRPVVLDASRLERHHGAGFLARRFPTLTRTTRAHGLDWTREPIPVTPAAHYLMGGIRTDLDGRTSLAGLVAVGEAACTGAHGANRLASNSLLEALVFAWRAADALDAPAAARFTDEREVRSAPLVIEHAEAVCRPERGELQELMWGAAGLTRTEDGLRTALRALAGWAVDEPVGGWDRAALEDRSLLDLARLVVAGALAREESRGAHHRADRPHPDADHRHAVARVHPARVLEGAVR